ncbi:septal ring lytic transglycosylase RlpA family protein [Pseudoroseomonas cervicalis]|uniref:septal ring lytic transglycosylase RlpA family protein n=1 Tax=Teichococcus cervicalis TaxID=204525 RepID=UPI0022F15AD0|nr:septal ring lytic transglycosylase RlpA family protein [Pseudoroseomonas cervicalis]WBV43998.1 septal ring lytic transglycosylase RlpA family protein [Pseudoroseomonas cervicalis]
MRMGRGRLLRAAGLALLCLGIGGAALAPPAEARQQRREAEASRQRGTAAPAAGPRRQAQAPRAGQRRVIRGRASYYANRFHGRRMANGRRFDRHAHTAASRTLPLGSRARVRNLENGRSATVTITDRGPHLQSRVIDLSPATAAQLGMLRQGLARVEVIPLTGGEG